jgi:hypothetical protein
MKRQFVFQQFSSNGVGMAHTPLFSLGLLFLAMGLLVLALPEILIFFVSSFLIFFGVLFITLGFKAWRISKRFHGKEKNFGETEIIDNF